MRDVSSPGAIRRFNYIYIYIQLESAHHRYCRCPMPAAAYSLPGSVVQGHIGFAGVVFQKTFRSSGSVLMTQCPLLRTYPALQSARGP